MDHYHDPEIVDSLPTYQYCDVPLDKELPAVSYDILEELFIPDEESYDNENQHRFISEAITNNLVDEALRITGKLEAEDEIENQRQGRKWRPAGKIKVLDDKFNNYIALHCVKFRARRWYNTHRHSKCFWKLFCNCRFRRKDNYSDELIQQGGYTHYYTFTEEDYNLVVDCE